MNYLNEQINENNCIVLVSLVKNIAHTFCHHLLNRMILLKKDNCTVATCNKWEFWVF